MLYKCKNKDAVAFESVNYYERITDRNGNIKSYCDIELEKLTNTKQFKFRRLNRDITIQSTESNIMGNRAIRRLNSPDFNIPYKPKYQITGNPRVIKEVIKKNNP